MKLATFKTKAAEGSTRVGLIVDESVVDVSSALGVAGMQFLITNFGDLREDLDRLRGGAGKPDVWLKLNEIKLVAPIERPGKIICLAGNYREHISESGFVVPESETVFTQQLFLKPSTTIIGNDDEIVIGNNNVKVGWETELAVIIGKGGRNIPAESAFDHVFGYTIVNDVSERGLNSKIQNRHKREMDRFLDWLAGKWFDTFAPCGPWIVTADEVDDPHKLEIKLTINGDLRQHGNTRDMIFSIPEQIAYASSIMTLEPGDIISTGTPAGAGIGGAATSLENGDTLICEIERIGTLKNRVRYID
jgi:2-keto-4-pentenoate hydratase/2-oxohepta-3-ene-1,7-dioic acid hydratase in catechol pathway